MNNKDESFWKQRLSLDEYTVMRQKGTEVPFSGEYVHTKEKGMYVCKACGAILFSSDTKFDSGTGWPSFDAVVSSDAVVLKTDDGNNMNRVEVSCKRCGSHLGHMFDDGPTKTGKRFCINSICLEFKKEDTK